MKNLIMHKANTRGNANHGWLNSKHTFSFGQYYNPERMNFGVLRVLNDDIVEGGNGFGTHPHDNMEIISIPIKGDLEHRDNMGNVQVIKQNDVQIMSAGTGITHSEYNKNELEKVNFLQIWIYPNKKNVEPRYDQQTFKKEDRINKLQQVLSPNANDEGVWIHQDAWFHLGILEENNSITYNLKKEGNGIYVFNIEGNITINNNNLETRDGIGFWNTEKIEIKSKSVSEFLIMEIPMNLN
jgi:redox-sensitive bicupin YhaK (pirin superfamily)